MSGCKAATSESAARSKEMTPGAGNVAVAPGGKRPQGIGADLGEALGRKLGVTVEWVAY